MFNIEIDHDLEGLLADEPWWNSFARGVPFRESSWLGPWWQHLGRDKKAVVVVARDESFAIRGLLPLYRDADPAHGRTLRMVGDGEACSDHVSVLAKEDDAAAVAEAMGRYLAAEAGKQDCHWDLIDIEGIVEGDEPMIAFARGLDACGAVLHTHSRVSTWYKPANESWEEHLKHHGKTQRRRMRRMSEKIGEQGCFGKVVAKTEQQIDEVLDALIELHQRRWNDAGENGSYHDPDFCRFIRDAAKRFGSRGCLYMTALEYQDQLIAAEFNVIGGNRVLYSYSAGYDIDKADLEPGRVLCVDTLMELYRQRLAGMDYMRGDEEYKKRFTTESRRLLRLRAVAPSLLPRLRHAAWWTQFELKQWMRKSVGRPVVDVCDLTSTPT